MVSPPPTEPDNVEEPPEQIGFGAAPTLVGVAGGEQQLLVPVFLGFAAATVKSALLLSVSTQPLLFRRAAVVVLMVPVGPAPSKQSVPLP